MRNLKKGIAIVAVATLFMSGCSSMKTDSELTGEKGFNNTSKHAAVGVTSGAAIGAFGGAAGAAIGAVVGGTAGGYYGYTLDEAREKLGDELEEMGIVIDDVDGVIHVRLSSHIMFEKGSIEVLPHGKDVLDRFLKIMIQAEGSNYLKVSGHTDNSGNRDFNVSLSEARAKEVAFYLFENGFPSKQIDYTGYADLMPIADNATEEGMEKNRRVTIEVIPAKVKY